MFLTRTSYHKTTHVNSYYGAWPGYMGLFIPMNSMKRQNDRILKEELPRSVGAQCATGDQWRNNSRKNEGMEPKQKEYPAVDVTGGRSKVRCCKEQYCIGTWNVRSMNQGKLEVVKQEMARLNVDILGISKLKWTGMGEFNSDDHYIYYPTPRDPMDCSPPGSFIHGIFQATVLEWGAIAFSVPAHSSRYNGHLS